MPGVFDGSIFDRSVFFVGDAVVDTHDGDMSPHARRFWESRHKRQRKPDDPVIEIDEAGEIEPAIDAAIKAASVSPVVEIDLPDSGPEIQRALELELEAIEDEEIAILLALS